jgi:predicted SprT family Zn-dependent metalloprotease
MIEAKLGNELGFLRALISHSCHLFLWHETKKYMNKDLEYVSAFHWWFQEVLEVEVCSLHHDPLRVPQNHSICYPQVLL